VAETVPDCAACAFEVTCSYDFYSRLSTASSGGTLVPAEGLVEDLRVIKDPVEVDLIRDALDCARRRSTALPGQ